MPINFDHSGNLIVTNDGLLTYEMTGAIRVPTGTTAQQPVSPVSGMIRYNSTLNTFEGYTTSWQDLLGGGGSANITISDTAPVGPVAGEFWYKTSAPVGLYLWYVDVDSSQWILVAGSSYPTSFYDISFFVGGIPTASELLCNIQAVRAFSLPSTFLGSYATASVASTGTAVFSIRKNGTQFGTLTFTSSATGVFSSSPTTTINIGDQLSIVAPGTPDATLQNISINLKGSTS